MTNEISLAQRLIPLVEGLGAQDRVGVEALRAIYAKEIHFEDPMQEVRGIEPFIEVMHRLSQRARELRFEVTSVAGSDTECFLGWTMSLRMLVGPTMRVEGVSHLRARNGMIYYHKDYWDLANLVASGIPLGRSTLRLLLRPFA